MILGGASPRRWRVRYNTPYLILMSHPHGIVGITTNTEEGFLMRNDGLHTYHCYRCNHTASALPGSHAWCPKGHVMLDPAGQARRAKRLAKAKA